MLPLAIQAGFFEAKKHTGRFIILQMGNQILSIWLKPLKGLGEPIRYRNPRSSEQVWLIALKGCIDSSSESWTPHWPAITHSSLQAKPRYSKGSNRTWLLSKNDHWRSGLQLCPTWSKLQLIIFCYGHCSIILVSYLKGFQMKNAISCRCLWFHHREKGYFCTIPATTTRTRKARYLANCPATPMQMKKKTRSIIYRAWELITGNTFAWFFPIWHPDLGERLSNALALSYPGSLRCTKTGTKIWF